MSNFIGHERQLLYLDTVFKRGMASHAYLFYGPSHVGKYACAIRIAQFFNCGNRGENKKNIIFQPCGECSGCVAIFEARSQDVIILDRDHTLVSKKEERTNIPIEDIRELKRLFFMTSISGRRRIAIINGAEDMNEEAASAFLKLLEEPGQDTLFFLIAESKEFLFPTIVSRTQAVRFSLVSDELMAGLADSFVSEKALKDEMVSYALGRPGFLVNMAKDRAFFESQKSTVRLLNAALRGSLPNVFRLTECCVEEESFSEIALLRCMAFISSAVKNESLQNFSNASLVLASLGRVNRIMEAISTTNANRRVAFDLLFLEVRNIYATIYA